jgi:hypothetical protein
MYGFEGSYLAFELLLSGLLFFLIAPWVSMAVPQAKKPLQLAAGGALLYAINAFFGPILYMRFDFVRTAMTPISNLLFWGGLAATVFFVCQAAANKEEVR